MARILMAEYAHEPISAQNPFSPQQLDTSAQAGSSTQENQDHSFPTFDPFQNPGMWPRPWIQDDDNSGAATAATLMSPSFLLQPAQPNQWIMDSDSDSELAAAREGIQMLGRQDMTSFRRMWLDPKDVVIGEPLGQGRVGVVYKGSWNNEQVSTG